MSDYFDLLLSGTHYCAPIMLAMQIVATIICWTNRRKFPRLNIFHFYPIAGIIQFSAYVVAGFFSNREFAFMVVHSSVNVFTLVEVALFFMIALRELMNKRFRIVLFSGLIVFVVYCIIVWSTSSAFFNNSSRIYPIESVIMLIPPCLYFINLFKVPPTLNLFDQPIFWINVGAFITFSCILPLNFLQLIIQKYVDANFDLYYINYLCYTVNYFFISRAYRCRKFDKISLLTYSASHT